MTVLPALAELEGFCSASLMVDRASGRGVSSADYDSVDAMERNRDQLDRLRDAATQEAGAEVLEERDFELAIAHLPGKPGAARIPTGYMAALSAIATGPTPSYGGNVIPPHG